jgi:hypothetical protein
MQTIIQYGIMLLSLCFWFYIDSVKLVEKNLSNSSLIHGIICGIGINAGYLYNPSIIYNYTIASELYDMYIIVPLISFGYGFYDLYIGIKSNKFENILHGILFIICNMYVYINNNILLSYTFLITETSSIFLNLRVYRKQWIDLLFALTFFIYRIICSPALAVIYLSDTTNTDLVFGYISSISISILNLYWFSLIVKKILKNKEVNKHSE